MSRVRKRLSAEERRSRILAAAVHAFARDGYELTKMDSIAARAEISKPVLYDHFPSKQALFLAVLESIRDGLISKGKSVAKSDTESKEKLRHSVDAFLQFVEDEPDAARVLLIVPSGDPAAAEVSREVQAGASAGIAALLVAFMPGSPPWRVRATSELLKEGLHALAIWWIENPGQTRDEIVDVVMRVFWPGLQVGAQTAGIRAKEKRGGGDRSAQRRR